MEKYILNPRYTLRNEQDKIVLLMRPNSFSPTSIHVLHPIYAMMISFVDGVTIEEAAEKVAEYLNISKNDTLNILQPLINNESVIKGYKSSFPPQTLVEYHEGMKLRKYKPNNFICTSLNLKMDRLKFPADIICNITMKCKTSCIYCYADRKKHQNVVMPMEKICEIIDEAHERGVVSFKLMGGDIFTHPHWDIILKKLQSYNYSPCISTKIPLNREEIKILKSLNADEIPIQISLDSFLEDTISQILCVNGDRYLNEMKTFFLTLEEFGIKYSIHTVLCSINDNISNIKSLENIIQNKQYLQEWYINSAKCSMYLPYSYSTYKPTKENIIKITEYVNSIKAKYPNIIIHSPHALVNTNNLSMQYKEQIFNNRNACSGNVSSLYILPDGKVTICEELYWHPQFILGDLYENTINEIWNSTKAVNLFKLQHSSISEDSACKTCTAFEKCRSYKHVCWRDVILAYGGEHWDYPDLFCSHAPIITKDIAME